MSESAPTLLHRWFEEVWNQGRTETIDELFAPKGLAHGLSDGDGLAIVGPQDFKNFCLSRRSAFPDVKFEIADWIMDGDRIWMRCIARGTHTGYGLGVPPTGKFMEMGGVTIVRIRDNKIVESWNFFDFIPAYVQLGLVEFKVGR